MLKEANAQQKTLVTKGISLVTTSKVGEQWVAWTLLSIK